MRRFISLAAAGALLAGTLAIPAAEARPGYRHYGAYGGQPYRPYRHRRGNAGAAVALGVAGALIGGAIAAHQSRGYGYGYGGPAYGAYGPPPGYYGY